MHTRLVKISSQLRIWCLLYLQMPSCLHTATSHAQHTYGCNYSGDMRSAYKGKALHRGSGTTPERVYWDGFKRHHREKGKEKWTVMGDTSHTTINFHTELGTLITLVNRLATYSTHVLRSHLHPVSGYRPRQTHTCLDQLQTQYHYPSGKHNCRQQWHSTERSPGLRQNPGNTPRRKSGSYYIYMYTYMYIHRHIGKHTCT